MAELNQIMAELNQITQEIVSSVEIIERAFTRLITISRSPDSSFLPQYLGRIARATQGVFLRDVESLTVGALGFWCSLCQTIVEVGNSSSHPCCAFIKENLESLVYMFLVALCKQDESKDKEFWDVANKGDDCLKMVAKLVGYEIVPLVGPWIDDNLDSPEWRNREAAIRALCSILEGPSFDTIAPIAKHGCLVLAHALEFEEVTHVRLTTAWALGHIFDVIGRHYNGSSSTWMTDDTFFEQIVESLRFASTKKDAINSGLVSTAFEALTMVLKYSTNDTIHVLKGFPDTILERFRELKMSDEDYSSLSNNLVAALCKCLVVSLRTVKSLERQSDFTMNIVIEDIYLFTNALYYGSATVQEATMLAIGSIASAVGSFFGQHMEVFWKLTYWSFDLAYDYQVHAAIFVVVKDICMASKNIDMPRKQQSLTHCDTIMTRLLDVLDKEHVPEKLQPLIFSCIGDIALFMGKDFEKHLKRTVEKLQLTSAGGMLEDHNPLRDAVLEAYWGIYKGFKEYSKLQGLNPGISSTFELVATTLMDLM